MKNASLNESNEMVKTAYKAMEDKKAENIKVIKIGEISVIADYFIIANGNSASQVEAITDNVIEFLGRAGHEAKRIEGARNNGWVLIDYGDIVVHIFSKEDRLFYDLERIWKDGTVIDVSEL